MTQFLAYLTGPLDPSNQLDNFNTFVNDINAALDAFVAGNFTTPAITGGTIDGAAINTSVIGGVTPAAGTFTTLASTGLATLASGTVTANLTIGGYSAFSVGNALTAAGNNRATALQLAKQVNNVTTAAASTGVLLPVGVIGMEIEVYNNGANSIQVYGTASETIDGTAGSTGVALANTKRCRYTFVAANTWLSAQLGAVSA